MATVFFLPKAQELTDWNITNIQNNNNNLKIINPNGLVINDENGVNIRSSSLKIVEKINELTNDETELYLLYHIGNVLNIDEYIKQYLPQLTPCRYSHTDSEKYQKIRNLIKSVNDNNISQSVESIIKEFFYDKVLEAKLELLHECLVPSGIPPVLPTELKNTNDSLKYEKDFNTFRDNWKKETNEEIFNPDFIKELTKLRITLLGS